MDYRIEAILSTMRELDESANRMPMAKLSKPAVTRGLELSRTVCRQPDQVFATPLMRNLLVCMGDVKQEQLPDGTWKTQKLAPGKKTKAVALVNKWVEAALLRYNGPKVDAYDETKPVGDVSHYNTDCWLGWKKEIWDIAPGQAEQRSEVFRQYAQATTNFSVEQMIKFIEKDPVFQKALLITLEGLPEVTAGREVRELSDPFMSKGTGVSYPDYRNDRTIVDGQNISYGKYEIELTAQALAKGLDALTAFAYDNNVYTGYPRNQRGKGRALEAQSRRTNLVVNLLNAPEMEAWKTSPILGTGFGNEETIKHNLVKKAEFIESHPEYVGRNEDTSGWDRSVGAGWITLSGALRYLKTNGDYSKKLVEIRHNCARKAWFIDGPNNSVSVLYGRTPSGYDDTTLLNSSVHRALANGALLSIDPYYTEKVVYPTKYEYLDVLGDDFLAIFPAGSDKVKAFRKYYLDRGYTIHEDEKSIFGVMFIQYRCIRHPATSEWIIAYNWPRVYRSGLSKETAKQLGAGGWTISWYQQAAKIRQFPEMMAIPINLWAACDKHHLMLDVPIEEIKRMVELEEQTLKQKLEQKKSKNARNRYRSIAERLSSNPNLPGTKVVNGEVVLDWDYFGEIQKEIQAVYDPEFLPKLGFKNPDLSLVH